MQFARKWVLFIVLAASMSGSALAGSMNGDVAWLDDAAGDECMPQSTTLRAADSVIYDVALAAVPRPVTVNGTRQDACQYTLHIRKHSIDKDILTLTGTNGITETDGSNVIESGWFDVGIMSLIAGTDQIVISTGGCGGSCSQSIDRFIGFQNGQPFVLLAFDENNADDHSPRKKLNWTVHANKLTLAEAPYFEGDALPNPRVAVVAFDPKTLEPLPPKAPEARALYEKVVVSPDWGTDFDKGVVELSNLAAPYANRAAADRVSTQIEQPDENRAPSIDHSKATLEQEIDAVDAKSRAFAKAFCDNLPSNYDKVFDFAACDELHDERRDNALIIGGGILVVALAIIFIAWRRRTLSTRIST